MTNTLRITRLSMALTVAAGLAACNDLSPSPHQVAKPIVAAPPPPSELPPPPVPTTPTPQAATDEQPKLQPTAAKADEDDDDDQEIEPSQALAGARKLLAGGNGEGALRMAKLAVLRTPTRSGAWNVLGRAQLVARQTQGRHRLLREGGRSQPAELVRAQQPRAGAHLRQALRGGRRLARAGGRARARRGIHVEQPRNGVRAARSSGRRPRCLRQGGGHEQRARRRQLEPARRGEVRHPDRQGRCPASDGDLGSGRRREQERRRR